ncbi:RNA polymerase sigma factor RpoE [Dokdonia pacifica]|uniref:RNA polymerase sigma-70 factor, ECF subfamily n=1 Tax=Dokdonia pacifica TaxID=1627892 RepID=A0A239B5L8_9FLAO|nr:RNA polymerase sigma factor [Dokdonia pacifica]GGG33680.1 RNA polymerase sigma factor RpoE [Dokdonia pacifica]SNS03166.1 RNA polymerase sigma-70 factor, ECF subfamily [Dokdonia pacifica]
MKSSRKIEDAWFVIRYCEGHKSAMAVLVKRWHRKFCKQAYSYANDFDIAKDIAQDAWITILKNIHTLEHPDKFGAWGLSIVTKKSIDWYRKNKRTLDKKQEITSKNNTSIVEETAIPENLLVKEKLRRAIASLSKEQQSVLKLFYIESYGLIEISEILHISKGTVKSRLYYAREKLKTILKN